MNYKQPQYIIVHGTLSHIEQQVELHLMQGWKCQGGICVFSGSRIVAYQAMIKEGSYE